MEVINIIKLKVSYEKPEEIERVLEKLGKDVKRLKVPGQQEGRFLKAYIEMTESNYTTENYRKLRKN